MCHPMGRDVERRAHLGIGAREIEMDRVALDRQGDLDADRHLRAEVVLHVLGEPIGAVGDLADRHPRPLLGVVEDRVDPLLHRGEAELADHLLDAPVARADRGHHRLDVAPVDVGDAAVVSDQVLDVFLEHATPVELGGPEPQAFLEDLGRPRPDARRHRAPDVGGVDEGVAPADDAPLVEDRAEDVDVRQMRAQRARQIRVVADDDVALVVVIEVAEGVDHVEPEIRRGAQAPGIGDVLSARRHESGREVRRLLHERRVGGALHDPRHVLHHRLVVVAQDLERDPIDGHGYARSITRLPNASTDARKPAGTRVVVSSCSMTAGPSRCWPARRSRRWYTAASWRCFR